MILVYYMEDDSSIAENVREFLGCHGFLVEIFPSVSAVKKALEKEVPAVVLIDWSIPDGTGGMLCQWIRSKWKELPVIFLTVRGDTREIVSGFQCGGDDYVTKPFELEVLLLRIQALLRRSGNVSKQYLSCGPIFLDQKQRLVLWEKETINLSPSEYELLLYFLQNKGKIVTRERLLETIWDSEGRYVNDNTLTVAVKRLREKLHHLPCLKTIRSIGYRMEEME